MSNLDKSLAQIDDFLENYPNASVKVKFKNSDNYRHFAEDNVKNDSFCDSDVFTVATDDFDPFYCDSDATVVPFSEWFKINSLEVITTVATPLATPVVKADDIATAERQTRTPIGVRLPASDALTVDWADLGEREFEAALKKITSVQELIGVANRRRLLGQDFKKWSEVQQSLILHRKFILENTNA
jgi:hypothetical protein